jgi:hypothetical protein
MMKLKLGSFLMVAVMFLTGLTAGASAGETANNQTNVAEYNVVNAGYLMLPNEESTGWCTVVLNNPRSSLNVRNSNGRVVAKLKHGTAVYVDMYDGGWARVSVRRRGRLGILGWVASEYLYC